MKIITITLIVRIVDLNCQCSTIMKLKALSVIPQRTQRQVLVFL